MLEDDGYEVRRSVLDATSLRDFVAGLYAALDAGCAAGEATLRAYREWNGIPLATSGILPPDNVAALMPDGWRWRPEVSFARRCCLLRPSAVQWHCDAEAAGTAGLGECVNAWLPLDPVGDGERPSLELICGSHLFMRGYRGKEPDRLHRRDEWVAGVPGERITPRLELGDVMLIDHHHLLHRTEQMPIGAVRFSLELRFSPCR